MSRSAWDKEIKGALMKPVPEGCLFKKHFKLYLMSFTLTFSYLYTMYFNHVHPLLFLVPLLPL